MTDYMYGSARLRAKELALIGRERIETLLACDSVERLWERLIEFGVTPVTDASSGERLREETLLSLLRESYREVCELFPDDPSLRLWLYQYDCNNVKAAIKGFVRGIDARSMMFDFGTLSIDDVLAMVRENRFDALPTEMSKAATIAVAEYAKTKNPQLIDLYLDRACYADMLADAKASGIELAARLVESRIDLVNIQIVVRILRIRRDEAGRALLKDAFLEGGHLSLAQLVDWFDGGEDVLWDRLFYSDYYRLAQVVQSGDRSLTAIECALDDEWMHRIQEVKLIPYGAEVAIAYLLAHEYEVRNLRILFAAKSAGLAVDTTRERIRESYV
jgi:V/A-type H+-transporting ATPase subunit C